MPKIKIHVERILLAALLLSVLCLPATAPAEEAEDTPRYRALLIACDQFVEATETTPIGENNLRIMNAVLEQDTRGFIVKQQYGITYSKESLAYAIDWAFRDAKESDVSLLYISTHGDFITSHNNPHGVLLLSDGALEDRVTAHELNEMLDKVPGTKVLLVDACNSGALIGKGVSPQVGSTRVARTFQSAEYKVLTSSGASEPSWYLLPTLEFAPPGSSYFTTALAVGAGLIGGYAADANRDGIITLKEMYDHLWVSQASSAVQMFPQENDFPLFVYDKAKLNDPTRGELTGFVFGSTALQADMPVLDFGYTATTDTQVAYRITYLRGDQWDWVNGVTLRDDTEWDGDVEPLGFISSGRKQISLDLSEILPPDWTYAMIHIMTIGDMDEGKQPFIYASRVLSARQTNGDPSLTVSTNTGKWNPKHRRELEIFVGHDAPCNLTVAVQDADGTLVHRLATSRATRPQALAPSGSLFYWNGEMLDGQRAPAGTYTIVATTRIGGSEYEASREITLE